ncbi:pikachurin, partial [Lates japonicus]
MVSKVDTETEYLQFVVRGGTTEVGSGDYGRYITDSRIKDDDGFDIDDSDYDIFIEELKPFPGISQDNKKSQLRSHSGPPSGRNVVYRMNTQAPPNVTAPPVSTTTSSIFADFTDLIFSTTSEPSTTPYITTTAPPTTTSVTLPTTTTTPTMSPWKGEVPRVYDLTCDDTVCPPDSFCLSDYDSGGSRCHCNLGRRGDTCSEVVLVNFPRFYGHSHMTFEPLKNSYQTFQITLEFKADSEDGLLLYCGENEHGRGDFTSLSLVRGKLHYRFNCGTGAAQIVSESRIVLGQWHTVTVFRDGMSGWLRMDNDTPISGRSQ